MTHKKSQSTKKAPTRQQLIDSIEHISFEMNRFLCAAYPKISIPRPYDSLVNESCLLHSRNVGEFFFEDEKKLGDIRISHYLNELHETEEILMEIEISKAEWKEYKARVNTKLSHLTVQRLNSDPMCMGEKNIFRFDKLIGLFYNNLPDEFRENWEKGRRHSFW